MRIVAIGDSITQGLSPRSMWLSPDHNLGGGPHPENGTDSYRRPLYLSLRRLGCSVEMVGPITTAHLGPFGRKDFPPNHAAKWGVRAMHLPCS